MSLKRKRSVLSIKDKNKDADDIAFQMICESVVLGLNVVFYNIVCSILLFINIHIFDYPDPRLFGLFRVVPTSPDNRGSTLICHVSRDDTSPIAMHLYFRAKVGYEGISMTKFNSQKWQYN